MFVDIICLILCPGNRVLENELINSSQLNHTRLRQETFPLYSQLIPYFMKQQPSEETSTLVRHEAWFPCSSGNMATVPSAGMWSCVTESYTYYIYFFNASSF